MWIAGGTLLVDCAALLPPFNNEHVPRTRSRVLGRETRVCKHTASSGAWQAWFPLQQKRIMEGRNSVEAPVLVDGRLVPRIVRYRNTCAVRHPPCDASSLQVWRDLRNGRRAMGQCVCNGQWARVMWHALYAILRTPSAGPSSTINYQRYISVQSRIYAIIYYIYRYCDYQR